MKTPVDPFRHHPELRDKIADPMQSFMRTFTITVLAAKMREHGVTEEWWYSDDEREAMRVKDLEAHRDRDLWIFGYGSLMWDPGIRFSEVRRAYLPGYARRFILKDIYGGRGTSRAPGLMAALDDGPGCHGLLFRIAREHIEEETGILWRREQIGPAYKAKMVEVSFDEGQASALTFVADHDAVLIHRTLTREEQIRFLATGKGFLGSSLDYLRNVATKLSILGIADEEVISLLGEAEAYSGSR